MKDTAELITAIGSLLAATAWPISILIMILVFRKEIRSAFGRVPAVLDRIHKIKMAGMEADLGRIAEASLEDSENPKGEVTVEQALTAAKIEAEADELGIESLIRELDKLCLEYDAVRRSLPASRVRTQAMTQILVKMRSLGPSVADKIEIYKKSGSPGSRLAAVAIMQMDPKKADLEWLADRFLEDQPFIFYHAALALSNAANIAAGPERSAVVDAARKAYGILTSFSGTPDQNTLDVLNTLLNINQNL